MFQKWRNGTDRKGCSKWIICEGFIPGVSPKGKISGIWMKSPQAQQKQETGPEVKAYQEQQVARASGASRYYIKGRQT